MNVSHLFANKQNLHSLIYFVADKPTPSNLSANVPLVGTSSYKTFLRWCGDMNVNIMRVRMYNQSDKPFDGISGTMLNIAIEKNHIKVIALGEAAKKYLLKTGINEFFVLPHPSGRNRLLNDKKFVKKTLEQCQDYIYKGVS